MSTTNDATILGKRSRAAFDANGDSVSDQSAAKQTRLNRTSLKTLECTSGVQSAQRDIFRNALNSQLLTDVTFKIGDDSNGNQQHFDVNRLLLAFFSPVFQSMLFGDMMESTAGGDVIINDMEPEIFECIINFAYAQNPKITNHNVLRLMKACDKYQIDSLYSISSDCFQATLNQEYFWGFFHEALELNIMPLVGQILYDALNTQYTAWLNADNIVEFFSIVHHKQLNNFLEIGYKFMQHESNVNYAALLVSDSFAKIFCSFCIEAIKIGAFNEQFQESAEKYFISKYKDCLDASNFCGFYLTACEHNLPVFQEKCAAFLSESNVHVTRHILESNQFHEQNLENTQRLLALPWQCSEEMLWENTVKWADNRSVISDDDDNENDVEGQQSSEQQQEGTDHQNKDENITKSDLKTERFEQEQRRYLLRSVRELIRFPLMSAEYFVKNVQAQNILSERETLTISTYFHCAENGCGVFKTEPRWSPRNDPVHRSSRVVFCDAVTGVFDINTAQQCSPLVQRFLSAIQNANSQGVRFWTQLKHMKTKYTDGSSYVSMTDLSSEDNERWVEVPRQWLSEIVFKLKSKGGYIGLEEKQANNAWSRDKGTAWKTKLQVGDIIEVRGCRTTHGYKWFQCVVRLVDRIAGKCTIQYTCGCSSRGYGPLDSNAYHIPGYKQNVRVSFDNSTNVAKRGTHTCSGRGQDVEEEHKSNTKQVVEKELSPTSESKLNDLLSFQF